MGDIEDDHSGDQTVMSNEDAERLRAIEIFAAEQGIEIKKKKRRTLLMASPTSFKSYKLGIIVAGCCKSMDLNKAYNTYLEYKAEGIEPNHVTFTNLLSLTAGLGEQGSGSYPPRVTEPPQDIDAASVVFADMRAAGMAIFPESVYTAMIRCYCIHGRSAEALALYKEMMTQKVVPKLRTFTPLLASFAEEGNDLVCFSLFQDLVDGFEIQPSEREYVSMLKLTTTLKDTRFYEILEQMMEDIFLPSGDIDSEGRPLSTEEASSSTWAVVRKWFTECDSDFTLVESDISVDGIVQANGEKLLSIDLDDVTRESLLKQVASFATSRIAHKKPVSWATGETAAEENSKEESNATEKKATIEDDMTEITKNVSVPDDGADVGAKRKRTEENHVHGDATNGNCKTDDAASKGTAVSGGGQGKKSNKGANKDAKWAEFTQWIQSLRSKIDSEIAGIKGAGEGGNCRWHDVIVDGANVGYFKQNYAGAPTHIDYRQVDWITRQLQRMGYSPLIILHSRHFAPGVVPEDFKAIVAAWNKEGILYQSPAGCNDDWFWLYAAVAMKCKVVTNDEMRDHHFQMLSPRWFQRWKERNQIHFSFGNWFAFSEDTTTINSANSAGAAATDDADGKSSPSQNQQPAGDEQPDPAPSGKKNMRKALLQIPRVYSHRMQRIGPRPDEHPAAACGFYFPAEGLSKWLCAYRVIRKLK